MQRRTAEAAAAEPAWPEDAIEVGRIVDAYGIKGWIKVQAYSGDPQALFASRRWFIQPPEGAVGTLALHAVSPSVLRITEARSHAGSVVAGTQEIADRNAAEALRGCRVFVSRASFPTPQTDEYYWQDLIGLSVVNRQGVLLGTVTGLLETGAHDVLRVADEGAAEERLIPFVAAYVDEVNLAERRIGVDWGLDF
jgi:16S rRNA processing protein RimM